MEQEQREDRDREKRERQKGIEMTILRGGTSPLAEHKPALHQPSDNTAEHMLKLNQSSDNTAKHTRPYCNTELKPALDQILLNTNKH